MFKLKYSNVDLLEKIAREPIKGLLIGDLKTLDEKVKKLSKSSEEKEKLGDVEGQYILDVRVLILLNNIAKLSESDVDQRYFAERISAQNIRVNKLEQKLKQLYEQTRKPISSSPDVVVRREQKTTFTNALPKTINCKELLNEINPNEIVLLIDVRKSIHFNESHIKLNERLANQLWLVNIAEEKIQKGLTARDIEQMLPESDQPKFKNRRLAARVVLMDWNSEGLGSNENLDIVFNALDKVNDSHTLNVQCTLMVSFFF